MIPSAPYRILEAIWYQSIQGKINEAEFKFPYINEAVIDLSDGFKLQKKLKKLSGSELIFEISDDKGHLAEFLIQANPVKKNESELTYQIIHSNLNGTTSKVLGWLNRTLDEVRNFYVEQRQTA